jgi:hypothetical protein
VQMNLKLPNDLDGILSKIAWLNDNGIFLYPFSHDHFLTKDLNISAQERYVIKDDGNNHPDECLKNFVQDKLLSDLTIWQSDGFSGGLDIHKYHDDLSLIASSDDWAFVDKNSTCLGVKSKLSVGKTSVELHMAIKKLSGKWEDIFGPKFYDNVIGRLVSKVQKSSLLTFEFFTLGNEIQDDFFRFCDEIDDNCIVSESEQKWIEDTSKQMLRNILTWLKDGGKLNFYDVTSSTIYPSKKIPDDFDIDSYDNDYHSEYHRAYFIMEYISKKHNETEYIALEKRFVIE